MWAPEFKVFASAVPIPKVLVNVPEPPFKVTKSPVAALIVFVIVALPPFTVTASEVVADKVPTVEVLVV